LTVGIGVIRLQISKWIPNLGALVKAAIFLGLGALGLMSLARGRPPANEFRFEALVPRWDGTIAYLPVLVFNALGFELMSSSEVQFPEDVPRAIFFPSAGVVLRAQALASSSGSRELSVVRPGTLSRS
jgi:hypothetical protein